MASPMEEAIRRAFGEHGLDPNLGLAIAGHESNMNPDAVNMTGGDARRGGSYGGMQMSLKTARGLGFNGSPEELFNPDTNAQYGAKLVKQLSSVHDKPEDIFAAYNSGKPMSMAPEVTRTKYVPDVVRRLAALSSASAPDAQATSTQSATQSAPAAPPAVGQPAKPAQPTPSLGFDPEMFKALRSAAGDPQKVNAPGIRDAAGNVTPAPSTLQLPGRLDPSMVRDVMDRVQRTGLIQGALSNFAPNFYTMKKGISTALPNNPAWDAAKSAAMQPLQLAKMDAEQTGAENAVKNQAALLQHKADVEHAKEKVALDKSALTGGAGIVKNIVTEQAKQPNRIELEHVKGAEKRGMPPNNKDVKDIGLMQNVADNMSVVGEMLHKHGSLANLKDKVGKFARLQNVVGSVPGLSGVKPTDPQTVEYMQDAQRYENALDGLVGNTALALEPRRIAMELQNKMNQQFPPAGMDMGAAKEALGRIAAHSARGYRNLYSGKADFYSQNGNMSPEEYDTYIMRHVTPPPSWKQVGITPAFNPDAFIGGK